MRHKTILLGGLVLALVGVLVGTRIAPPTAATKSRVPNHGVVDVLYAASLLDVMQQQVGPGLLRATGERLVGFPGGSEALANEIKAKTEEADVFISASPSVNRTLEGKPNGDLVSWFVKFARSPLVLGYDPASRFAGQLRHRAWYRVITNSRFRLGRTDPAIDPKGELTVKALDAAAAIYRRPQLKALATTNSDVYPEQSLVGLVAAGQLDAGFFYKSETSAAKLATIGLGRRVRFAATYTITIPNDAAHARAAQVFVAYLLSQHERAVLQKEGFGALRLQVSGAADHNLPAFLTRDAATSKR